MITWPVSSGGEHRLDKARVDGSKPSPATKRQFIMIYTLGCSFTKWYWHTWSDWLSEYSTDTVINLAWPGRSNQTQYWELLSRSKDITQDDTVIIMLSGSNRVTTWYDRDWIDQRDCQGFFPAAGRLECSPVPWRGLYRTHPDHETSLTHMIVDNFSTIYQIQHLLNQIGCRYHMVFWQNPWFDVRPTVTNDSWRYRWDSCNQLSSIELNTASEILKIPAVSNLLSLVDWNRFCMPPKDPQDPQSYQGLWEYKIARQCTQEYLECVHSDPHPDALIQHDFLVEIILGQSLQNNSTRARARELALLCLSHDVKMSYQDLIPISAQTTLRKVYE